MKLTPAPTGYRQLLMTTGMVVVMLALFLPLAGAIVADADCCDEECCTSSTLCHCACLNVAIVRDSYTPAVIPDLVSDLLVITSTPPASLSPESLDQPPRLSV
ncbi:MAG: hypothetical protein HY851_10090 [candidate division Zixibacteria bacterium]|nr:hypothetical protein [candidate division Zixibacteria bacterium]